MVMGFEVAEPPLSRMPLVSDHQAFISFFRLGDLELILD